MILNLIPVQRKNRESGQDQQVVGWFSDKSHLNKEFLKKEIFILNHKLKPFHSILSFSGGKDIIFTSWSTSPSRFFSLLFFAFLGKETTSLKLCNDWLFDECSKKKWLLFWDNEEGKWINNKTAKQTLTVKRKKKKRNHWKRKKKVSYNKHFIF